MCLPSVSEGAHRSNFARLQLDSIWCGIPLEGQAVGGAGSNLAADQCLPEKTFLLLWLPLNAVQKE